MSFQILLVGITIFLSMLIKSGISRIGVPSLIGYLVIGFLLRLAGSYWGFLSEKVQEIYKFLGVIGIIALLFRVGIESDIAGLISQLRRASIIWVGNILVSGLFGYGAAYFLLELEVITSLVIATAFTATSVGISVDIRYLGCKRSKSKKSLRSLRLSGDLISWIFHLISLRFLS